MIKEKFTGNWKRLFQQQGYGDFDALWNASLERVDEPNRTRGGHSEVGRLYLSNSRGGEQVFYLKRQLNYTSKTLSHPFTGIPPDPARIRHYSNAQRTGHSLPGGLLSGLSQAAGRTAIHSDHPGTGGLSGSAALPPRLHQ